MAVAFKTALGTGQATTSGTQINIVLTAAIEIGDLVVVRWASDNLNATTPTCIVSDGSNTYTVLRQAAVNATAAAGVAGGIAVTKATGARSSGTNITLTFSGAIAHKCAYAESFTGAEITTRTATVGATGTVAAASAGATGTAFMGDLVLGHLANETRGTITGDTDTSFGTWSTQVTHRSATSGSDATCVSVAGQYKILTASSTSQTYNVTAVAAEWVCQCATLQSSPEPAITQAAYQFFDDAGTESGAAPLGAQDTGITPLLVGVDGYGVLRVRLQNTTANAGFATDDYQVQWEKNASGSWTNVSTGGNTVIGYDNTSLTEGQTTTNRLGAGTGSFVAGKVCEDGVANDFRLTASNYTELVFSLRLVAANLADADVLRFRVLRNGATMTYAVTPTITIKGPVSLAGSAGGISSTSAALTVQVIPIAVEQAAYRFYADDGSAFVSTPLANQDTPLAADPASSDVNLQLRMRLQSTSPGDVPAASDWSLQYEKNSSGTWTNAVLDGTETLADSYAETNFNGTHTMTTGSFCWGVGQTFLGNGQKLSRVSFWLSRSGTPPVDLIVELYAHTGTFGTGGRPTGAPLASAALRPASVVGTSLGWVDFTFDGSYTLANGTPYCITLYPSVVDNGASGTVASGLDSTSPTHPGNILTKNSGGTWDGTAQDRIFRLYTTPIPGSSVIPYDSPNMIHDTSVGPMRLTGGTGTPITGPVSETGVVLDWGWSAGAHIEVVYSIKLQQGGFTNGDTVRFRVLRNNSTNDMTYTATPTITIGSVVGPGPVALAGSSSGISSTTAALAPTRGLASTTGVGTSTAGGTRLAIARALAAPAVTGGATTTGDLSVTKAAVALAGSSSGTSTCGGPGGPGGDSDNFNRADATNPGPDWTRCSPAEWPYVSITNNELNSLPSGWQATYLWKTNPPDNTNCFAEIDYWTGGGETRGPVLCHSHDVNLSSDCYSLAARVWWPNVTLLRGDTEIVHWSVTPPINDPDRWVRLRLERVGAELRGYVDSTLVGTWTDPAPLTGTGIGWGSLTDANEGPTRMDNWAGGAIGAGGGGADLTVLKAPIALVGSASGGSTAAAAVAVARSLAAASGIGTSTATATRIVKAIPLAAATGTGTSTASATTLVRSVLLAGTAGGASTAGATTTQVARALAGTAGGLSTATAATVVARALAGTATGLSTTTGAVVKAVGLSGTSGGDLTASTLVDEDFNDGVTGTSINTTGYVTGQTWMVGLQYDGAGNARTGTAQYDYQANQHTTVLPADCWAEATFLKTTASAWLNFGVSIRMPADAEIGSAGYSFYDSGTTYYLYRGGIASGGARGPSPIQVGVPITYGIQMVGNVVKLFINGVEVYAYTDPAPLNQGPYTGVTMGTFAQGDLLLQRHRAGSFVPSGGGGATGTLDTARAVVALEGSAGGLSTATAAVAVARALAGTSTAASTTLNAPLPVVRALAGTATATSMATATTLVRAVALTGSTGTPTTTLIDDTFNGVAGTLLTASPSWVSDGWSEVPKLDGAGNAVAVTMYEYQGVTSTVPLPADCWLEASFTLPVVLSGADFYFQIRMPALAWYHGYNLVASDYSDRGALVLFRDDFPSGAPEGAIVFQAGATHTARIEARGANFKLYFDGALKIDWTDPSPLSGGLVGPYAGFAIDTESITPADGVKVRSYSAGGLASGPGSSAAGVLAVARALAGSSLGQSTAGADIAGSSARALEASASGLSSASATGLVSVQGLAGSAAATSTASAVRLVAQRALTGAAGGSSTATGSLAVQRPLAGSAASSSTASGTTVVAVRGLVALTGGTSATTGAFAVARALTAPVAGGTSTTTGTLAAGRPLAAASGVGGSTTTGAVIVARLFVASATGGSTATGALRVARAFVATSTGAAGTSGNAVVSAAGGMSSYVAGASTATGSLGVARSLAGSTSGISTASGTSVAKTVQLTAIAGGLSTTTAVVAATRSLTGASGGGSTTTGSFVGSVSLVASSSGGATATGLLGKPVLMVGATSGLSAAAGTSVAILRSLIGTTDGLSTTTGDVRRALALVARADGLSATLAEPMLTVGLRGATNGVAAAVGTLEAFQIVAVYGMWNGEIFEEMQYGDKQVVDWMMIT